jgi:hypothetical protein
MEIVLLHVIIQARQDQARNKTLAILLPDTFFVLRPKFHDNAMVGELRLVREDQLVTLAWF